MMKRLLIFLVIAVFAFQYLPAQQKKTAPVKKEKISKVKKSLVTFVELGSVNCIPCKAMQKVMKSIEEKYGSQIKIIFYDVWTEEQAHYAQDYQIRIIPTQVFLDSNGKELMRHEGFFPEKEIDAFLQSKGLEPKLSAKE
jgi:thioredoxin 1